MFCDILSPKASYGCVASPVFSLLASIEGTTICLEMPLQTPPRRRDPHLATPPHHRGDRCTLTVEIASGVGVAWWDTHNATNYQLILVSCTMYVVRTPPLGILPRWVESGESAMQDGVHLLCHPKFRSPTRLPSISAIQHTVKSPQRPLVLHHCHKNREGPPQDPLPSSLGCLILRVFPRGVPGGSSGGTYGAHWAYVIFGFSPSFTHFHPFSHFFAHFRHIHSFLG